MKKHVVLIALFGLIGSFGLPAVASAAPYNLATLISNIGFESGLAGWTYTGAGVNANTYLTSAEWANEIWTSSSPFPGYTDAQLAINYPDQPWGLNPDITHKQQTVEAGGVIGAAVGSNFVGSRQDGYEGHYLTGGAPDTPDSYYDTNFQLRTTFTGSFLAGDTFSLTTWGNRGRLRNDTNVANTTSTLNFKLTGPGGYTSTCAFSNWGVDGAWASQVCTWTLTTSASSLNFFVTGQNSNHDRYVAVDMGPEGTPGTTSAVPEPGTLTMLGIGLTLAAMKLRARKQ